jgi:hypothetical protein
MNTAHALTDAQEPRCKDRVRSHLAGRLSDLRKLFRADPETPDPDLGTFNEYGLSFDYVAPGTFKNRRGYWRYQLSWGGPSDEFRFYCDENRNPVRIEYWLLDWWDGARITLRTGCGVNLLRDIFADFKDMGAVDAVYSQASED